MTFPRIALAPLVLVAGLTSLPGASFAQAISEQAAIDIARQAGLATIEDVDFDDGDWEIEGDDANGRDLELWIDGDTGEILRRDD